MVTEILNQSFAANAYCHSPYLLRIYVCQYDRRLTTKHRKESITMEENNHTDTQEDPAPLTDEEFARLQKKQKREGWIFTEIIDFILHFFD